MTHTPATVVVPPSLPRLLLMLIVAGAGMIGGLMLIIGVGPVLHAVAAIVGGWIACSLAVAIVWKRPRVELTPQGFTLYKLFGQSSRTWDEVHGEFAPIKIGWTKGVGYNLRANHTPAPGPQGETKRSTVFSGYDTALSGAFALSADALAALLNTHARQHAQTTDDRA